MKFLISALCGLLVLAGCAQSPERTVGKRVARRLQANQPFTALELADQFLQAHPESITIQKLRVILLLKTGQDEQALAALAQLPAAESILPQALGHSDPEVRTAAARLIANYQVPAVPLRDLLTGLTDSESLVRSYCARAVGRRQTTAAQRALYACLGDENWLVRAEVATALGRQGDVQALGWLVGLLSDPDGYVRYCALTAISELPRDSTLALLQEKWPRGKSRNRLQVSLALAKLGDTAVLPVLTNALSKGALSARLIMVDTLRDMPVSAATNLLQGLLRDPDPILRKEAIEVWQRVLQSAAQP